MVAVSESTAAPPTWNRLPGESAAAHERFLHYLDQGPQRQQRHTAAAFGVSAPSINEMAQRWRWLERAAAWDQRSDEGMNAMAIPVPERLLEAAEAISSLDRAPAAPVSSDARALELEHEAMLEIFRQEAEAVGRSQMKLARGFTAAAGRNIARLMASEKPLSARDVATLAQVSCSLAANATNLWGRAIGVDRLLNQMQRMLELEQQAVEEAQTVG